MKIPGLSFSWKRTLGVSKLKWDLARATGIPTTRNGIERKIGNTVIKNYIQQKGTMIQSIFRNVYQLLLWIASKTGVTYNEINIIVYYLLIPLSWTLMIDYIFHKPYTTIPFLLIWCMIGILKRNSFRQWCDNLFMLSVKFLNWFNRFGGNYVLNSVVICVFVPIAVYILILWYALK